MHSFIFAGFSDAQNSFTRLGALSFAGPNVNEVIISGNTAFARRGNSVDIIDLTNPSSPALLSTQTFQAGSVSGMAFAANRLFVTFANNFQILDVSNLSQPASLALVSGLPSTVSALAISGDRAYIGFGGNIRVYDVSNPASPSVLTTLNFELGGDVGEIDFAGDIAVARLSNVSPNRLEIIRVSAAASPSTGAISGRVTSADRAEPIAGARVSIEPSGAVVLSDINGSYSSGAIQPGAYSVSASFPGFQAAAQEAVQVASGETATANFQLTPSPGTITGRVTNSATGGPISGASVRADPAGASGQTGANGVYRLTGLAPGRYTIAVTAEGFVNASLEEVALEAGGTTAADLSLRPTTGAVAGRVADASSGLAIADATVVARPGDFRATTTAGGNYIIEGLGEGQFSLTVEGAGFQAQTRADVGVRGGEVASADFSLSPEPGSVSGRVIDALTGRPLPGASVSIAAIGLSAASDENGDFLLQGVSSGEVSVSASAESFLAASDEVLVRPGRQTRLDFSVLRDLTGGPVIASAGFGITPLTFSSSQGGAITVTATVLGGAGDVDVELFLRVQEADGRFADLPLGSLERLESGLFEIQFENLPPGTLPEGEFQGVRLVARDSEDNVAVWPALNVPEGLP